MQKFLTSTDINELNTLRTEFLTHDEMCVPHKENGNHYAAIVSNEANDNHMLCVLDDCEECLSQPQIDRLIDEVPDEFKSPDELI